MRNKSGVAVFAVAALLVCIAMWGRAQPPTIRPADVGNVVLTSGAVRVVIAPTGAITVFHPSGGAVSTRPGMPPGQSVTEIAAPVRVAP